MLAKFTIYQTGYGNVSRYNKRMPAQLYVLREVHEALATAGFELDTCSLTSPAKRLFVCFKPVTPRSQ